MSHTLLPVHECFLSFQGEGVHAGRSAFFIRLFGCPLHCPWCDSAGTWHKDYVPTNVRRVTAQVLVEEATLSAAEFVVVTGGEPTIHNLDALTEGLRATGIPSHLETSGAFPVKGKFDWVTVSPKDSKAPLREVVEIANEFKFIIEKPEDIDRWTAVVAESSVFAMKDRPVVWLHPEWSQRTNPEVLNAITNWVKKYGDPFRAGWQMHKLYRADLLDNRSAPAVPLGGDPSKGF